MPDTESTEKPAQPAQPAPATPTEKSGREARWTAAGVVALLGLFSYLAFGRSNTKSDGSLQQLRVSSVRASGGTARAEACAPNRGPCQKLAAGNTIPAGLELRTDYQSELRLSAEGGRELTLGRSSELRLGTKESQSPELVRGTLGVEIERGKRSFSLSLPHGSLSSSGAKLLAHADAEASRVEVTSGSARVEDRAGHASPVRAGEVARFSDSRFDVDFVQRAEHGAGLRRGR
ncbi:MAG: FecR domain-containing protein [Hyphomonadaceae bacterium]